MHKHLPSKNQGNLVIIVLIIMVSLLVVGGAGYLVLRSKNKDNTTLSSQNKTDEFSGQNDSTPVADENTTKTTGTIPLITDTEIILRVPGDEKKLPSVTPTSFVTYMKTKLDGFDCDFEQFPEGAYYVSKINANFVRGSFGCGGGAAITWYLEDGAWFELGYQSQVPCKDLVAHKIPSDFISECYDEAKPEAILNNPNGPLK